MGVTKKRELLRAAGVVKEFPTGRDQTLLVLRGLELTVTEGEFLIIVGPSGSGKSTLLHILGGLERPTSGEVFIEGENLFAFPDDALASFRNGSLGFIFQFHHLLPEFTALENVLMPALIRKESLSHARERGKHLLAEVGLADRLNHRPVELSGGEQQRVAVARALINEPRLVLADEPSGNLDVENGNRLHQLIMDMSRRKGTTFVIATHNPDLTTRGDRVMRLSEGKLTNVVE